MEMQANNDMIYTETSLRLFSGMLLLCGFIVFVVSHYIKNVW